MKKISTLFAAALLSASAMATDYNEPLTVEVNGTAINSGNVKVSVDKEIDGTYTFSLNNFKFASQGVGNIVVEGVKAIQCGNTMVLNANQPISIAAGDDPSVKFWLGPTLGSVDLYMNAQVVNDKLNAYLMIDGVTGMDIRVSLGDKADELGQLPNSGFEAFHTASVSMGEDGEPATSDEPNAWHSFMSASGEPALVYLAGYNPHTFTSKDVRPGSKGKQSVKLLALDMWIAIANGTITTGRMNTGSTTATDTNSNYAWSDLSSTDVDANGDPFYAVMTNMPDSIKLWVKYGQGKPNADHPYATVSAVLTDGTRYQDPENEEYKNVLAKANNPKIESTNGEWKELTIPFDYSYLKNNDKLQPKNMQVTISTNADAGQGSDKDSLLVDDVQLVYNSKLKTITYKGAEIAGFDKDTFDYTINADGKVTEDDFDWATDGIGAYSHSDFITDTDENGNTSITITVIANDLRDANVYTVTVKGGATAISTAKADKAAKAVAIYNLNGQPVQTMQAGEVYIVKYADGKTQKVVRK